MAPRVPVPGSVEWQVAQSRLPGLPPPSGRSQRSKQNKTGSAGEARAIALHTPNEVAGLCSPLKHGDSGLRPVGSMRQDGTIPCRPKVKGDVDFHATLRGGRHLLLEVKHIATDPPRWDLSELKDHQAAILAGEHAMGAACFVLVVSDTRGWLVPWPVVQAAREEHARGGRASLSADQLAPYAIAEGTAWLAGQVAR